MGRNAAIKHFSATAGQPLELLETKHARRPVIAELLASPWIRRASELRRPDGSYATKHAEEHVEVAWDAEAQRPLSFARDGHTYAIEAIAQIWVAEKGWWDARRRICRRFWRVIAEGGVYDLVYDRELGEWLLVGIQD